MTAETPLQPPVDGSRPPPSRAADRPYRWAWLSLLLYPVSFVAAFVVGEGLGTLLDERSPGPPSAWENLGAAVPALVVFAIPGALAVLFGRRAVRLGRPDGRAPAIVGVVLALAFAGTNLLAWVTDLLAG
jgi:hypothetical protein